MNWIFNKKLKFKYRKHNIRFKTLIFYFIKIRRNNNKECLVFIRKTMIDGITIV